MDNATTPYHGERPEETRERWARAGWPVGFLLALLCHLTPLVIALVLMGWKWTLGLWCVLEAWERRPRRPQ